MAIVFKDEKIKVVVFADSAVTCARSAYNLYLQSLDENLLELDGEPTRFVLQKVMPYDASVKLKNDLLRIVEKDGAKHNKANPMSGYNFQVNSGSQAIKEVKYTLCAIENPPGVADGLAYVADTSEPGACKELMGKLDAIGAVNDLHSARTFALQGKQTDAKKS